MEATKSGPHELAQYRATQIDPATNAEWKKERRMTPKVIEPWEQLGITQDQFNERMQNVTIMAAKQLDGDPLPIPDVTAEYQAQTNLHNTQQDAPKPRATAVPGKCVHCSRYWSAHDVVGNQAKCRGAAFAGKTFSTVAAKVEVSAVASAGVLTAQDVETLLVLDKRRTETRQIAEEHDDENKRLWAEFSKAEAEYFNHIDHIRSLTLA
jgi:hypothetical protein